MPVTLRAALIVLLPLAGLGCERMRGEDPTARETEGPPRGVALPPDLPLHPGPEPSARLIAARNPFAGDRQAIGDGYRLYSWYNCHGCHGTLGGGGIGPPLRDDVWIYGADPASLYQSIAQGRPQGMPAFGGIMSEDMIWRIVAYVQALAAGDDVPPTPMRPAGADAATDIQAEGRPLR
jgi:cytochrome c oxidase cbb3-type subunit III